MLYGLLVTILLLALAGGYALYWQNRKIQALQEQLAQSLHKQERQQDNLARRLDNYLSGSMQMGKELHELREQFAPMPDKLLQLEQRDPGSLSFIEAARLVGLGATTEDLQQACGLSHSEAELLQRIHGKK
ncbi:DUF2802 domain-containing protein [Thiopseudomonas denitrificans]|uniref:Uncharacterized protein DUF2802 n=1 Tax=Thiopseudomonas denitrificans TaxID=1501432 RepID=A0A4R6TVF1_9GAMM|nr:DUF2802 domain-containing protein [Thiopseudomonas denitrificans]TDQ36642.1 uncharacterized protein DUF2802 [Thiopseudomonas denitrificans]